jgi:hypothetical protein
MDCALLSTAYLPPIEYFYFLLTHESHLIEAHEFFQKQSYRSRCNILTSQGVLTLSIPVVHTATKIPIQEVKIDYKTPWQRNHWKSIITAYNKSPYFLYYQDYLQPFYANKIEYLWDFNTQLLKTLLKLLNLNLELSFTENYTKEYPSDYLDLRNSLNPKKQEITTNNQGISIIDLLFNAGNESRLRFYGA